MGLRGCKPERAYVRRDGKQEGAGRASGEPCGITAGAGLSRLRRKPAGQPAIGREPEKSDLPPEELERIARPRRVKGGCIGDRRWVAVRGRTRRTDMDTAVKDGRIWLEARLSSQVVCGGGLPNIIKNDITGI